MFRPRAKLLKNGGAQIRTGSLASGIAVLCGAEHGGERKMATQELSRRRRGENFVSKIEF